MSNLEKWIKAILNEDADNLSMGSVRTLQMIKHEFERLQKENAELKSREAKESDLVVSDNLYSFAKFMNQWYSESCQFNNAGLKNVVKDYLASTGKGGELLQSDAVEFQSVEYKLGYDAAINGPDSENCHFGIFSTPEKTKEWERGKKDGEKIINSKP